MPDRGENEKGKKKTAVTAVKNLSFVDNFLNSLAHISVFPNESTEESAQACLKYFKGEFDEGVFQRAVNIGTTQRVTYDNDESAKEYAKESEPKIFLSVATREKGNNDGFQTVGGKGNEHGERVEKEIAQERADAADQERAQRIKRKRRRYDDDIVQVKVTARYGDIK